MTKIKIVLVKCKEDSDRDDYIVDFKNLYTSSDDGRVVKLFYSLFDKAMEVIDFVSK